MHVLNYKHVLNIYNMYKSPVFIKFKNNNQPINVTRTDKKKNNANEF